MSAALMPTASAIALHDAPCEINLLMARTWFCFNLCPGAFSPRKHTSPALHWRLVFSLVDTHSRFSGLLSSLLPLRWSIESPGWYPAQNTSPTKRWTRYFLRPNSFFIATSKYPALEGIGDNILPMRSCVAAFPFLRQCTVRSFTLTREKLETCNPATEGTSSHISVSMSHYNKAHNEHKC